MALRRRALIVGAGSIGRRHARLLAEREDIEVALAEPNAATRQRAREEIGEVPAYASFEEALAAKPGIVVVATPHGLHAEQTVRALEAGAHVLCEKPISDRLEGARRMREAAEHAGRALSIGFHMHFHPGAQRMKGIIDSGAIGNVVHAHCRVGSHITLVNSGSRYQAELEGALLFDYAHQPDLLVWLLGRRPAGVQMAAVQGGDIPLTSRPNALTLVLDYDAPLLATVHLNYLQMPERHEYEIVGDRGWLRWDMKTGALQLGDRASESERAETISIDRDDVYRAEHQAFLDAVDGRRAPESPAAEATVSLEIIHAALRAWRERRRVPLDAGG